MYEDLSKDIVKLEKRFLIRGTIWLTCCVKARYLTDIIHTIQITFK